MDLLLYAGEASPNDVKLRAVQIPPNTFEIVNHVNTSVVDLGSGVYTIEKTAGADGAWNADAVSSLSAPGDFVIRILALQTNKHFTIGIDVAPTDAADQASIDRGLHFTVDPLVGYYENGVLQTSPDQTYDTSTYWWLRRLGSTVTALRGATLSGATLIYTFTSLSGAVFFDSSFYSSGGKAEVTFYIPSLTGQSVVCAQGSASVTVSIALTGQSVAADLGSVVAAPSFALTGQTATTALGTLTPAFSLALSGQALTAAQGSTTAGAAFALSGQNVSAAQGSVAPTASIAITGQSVSVAQGSIATAFSLALFGQTGAVSQGLLVGTNSPALTGTGITAAQGSIALTFSAALTGQPLIAGQGTTAAGLSRALSGADIATSQGSAANDTSIGLTGIAAFIAEGSLTAIAAEQEILFWQPGPLIGRRMSVSRSR